jgi:response regulator RpfG family c-di-GMP phosphodiesterase
MSEKMIKKRVTALSNSLTFQELWEALGSKLIEAAQGQSKDSRLLSNWSYVRVAPGCLRKSEFELIKDHAEIGYGLLKMIEFSWPVAQIVLQHHERMDGSGYPLGLTGEQMLIEARIMGVADVIESMSSHRPYRPAFSIENALLEIIMKKGVLYDTKAVEACFRLFNDKNFTFD